MSDPEQPFDAVAAAKELDDLLANAGANEPLTDGGEYIAALEEDLEEVQAVLAKKELELAQANQRADQAHAEIEAAGKRLENAAAKELERRARNLLESFLPVVDDLDRGIAAARKHAESQDVVVGLELVRRSMMSSLERFGVTHVPALGAAFDPRRHEAIALVPVSDPAQDGHVIDVMREGYELGGTTLRAASVAVGKRAG